MIPAARIHMSTCNTLPATSSEALAPATMSPVPRPCASAGHKDFAKAGASCAAVPEEAIHLPISRHPSFFLHLFHALFPGLSPMEAHVRCCHVWPCPAAAGFDDQAPPAEALQPLGSSRAAVVEHPIVPTILMGKGTQHETLLQVLRNHPSLRDHPARHRRCHAA